MKNGRGGRTTSPPLYLLDFIDLSSFLKERISEKAALLYESGHSLNEISQNLDVPRTTIRDALEREGVAIRPQGKWRNGLYRGAPPYGYIVVAGQLVEDAREQKIVGLIMSHWRSGKSLNAIAQSLNRQKIRPRRGKAWEHSTIRFIVNRNKTN